MSKEKYNKPPLSINEQISLLKKRGLIINDERNAEYSLKSIGYYRLSGYSRFYYLDHRSKEPLFKTGSTFEQIVNLYIFDRELRLLIMDAIERIEVSFKAIISNWMSEKYGPHWYLKRNLFLSTFYHEDLIKTIENETCFKNQNNINRKSPIFENYYNKYSFPLYPPSWMLAEGLSLGTWSRIFEYLDSRADKSAISDAFQMPYKVLQSWIQSLSYLRNICAHHLIVWNRQFHITPCIPHSLSIEYRAHFMKRHSLYSQLAMVHVFINSISIENDWVYKLQKLFEKHKTISLNSMGFSNNWYTDAFWNQKKLHVEHTTELPELPVEHKVELTM